MSKINSLSLGQNAISEITKLSPQRRFDINAPLFYEGQIPIVAYVVLDGYIQIIKNKKIRKVLKPGTMIGLNELMTNSPSKVDVQVQAESTLCFLDKSTIQEIMMNQKNNLSEILQEECRG